LFALVFAHQKLAAASRRAPGDAAPRITRLVVPELAELAAVTGEHAGATVLRVHAAASASGAPEQRAVGLRQHFDPVRVREGERDLEQARAALNLEREPVDPVLTDARRAHANLDRQAAGGWN